MTYNTPAYHAYMIAGTSVVWQLGESCSLRQMISTRGEYARVRGGGIEMWKKRNLLWASQSQPDREERVRGAFGAGPLARTCALLAGLVWSSAVCVAGAALSTFARSIDK